LWACIRKGNLELVQGRESLGDGVRDRRGRAREGGDVQVEGREERRNKEEGEDEIVKFLVSCPFYSGVSW
jgi:hypothetical protein